TAPACALERLLVRARAGRDARRLSGAVLRRAVVVAVGLRVLGVGRLLAGVLDAGVAISECARAAPVRGGDRRDPGAVEGIATAQCNRIVHASGDDGGVRPRHLPAGTAAELRPDATFRYAGCLRILRTRDLQSRRR